MISWNLAFMQLTDSEEAIAGGEIVHALHGRDTTACARAYAEVLDWPIAAGHRYRRTAGCTCRDTDPEAHCPAPGAHPHQTPIAPLPTEEVPGAFDAAPGAGIIAMCTRFDAITMPHHLGLGLMVALDRTGIHAPCMTADHTHATVLAAPGTGQHVAGIRAVTVHAGPDAWVALPPTHGVRWDTPPTATDPLPDARALRPHLNQVVRIAARQNGTW